MASTRFYHVLGVSREASQDDLRRAYLALAVPLSENRRREALFVTVSQAYEVLGDERMRALYDEGNEEIAQVQYTLADARRLLSATTGAEQEEDYELDDMENELPEFMRSPNPNDSKKPATLEQRLSVPLEVMMVGGRRPLSYQRREVCAPCGGVGGTASTRTERCSNCQGSGVKKIFQEVGMGQVEMHATCSDCSGRGCVMALETRCAVCHGARVVSKTKQVEIDVDIGCPAGGKILLKGEGDQTPGATERGDVVVVLDQKPHNSFTRTDQDLDVTVNISLIDALGGFTRYVRHLDGRKLKLTQPVGSITNHKCMMVVEKEGFPKLRNPYVRGDLYITFQVDMPEEVDPSLCAQIEAVLGEREKSEVPSDAEHVQMLAYDDYVNQEPTAKEHQFQPEGFDVDPNKCRQS